MVQSNRNAIVSTLFLNKSLLLLGLASNQYIYIYIYIYILEDKTYDKLIDTNIDNNIISKIIKFCKIHNKTLIKKEKDFLTNHISKTSNFYGLLKIHRSKQIENAIETRKSEYIEIPNPSDLKFRPIVAGPSCLRSRLSKIIDILLQPFLNKIKDYIKDNIDFLNFIQGKIDPNTLIATFDATNLYSNIPHKLGKQAISYWIE